MPDAHAQCALRFCRMRIANPNPKPNPNPNPNPNPCFCRMRIANVGKYNWRIVRDEYALFTSMSCPDMHDVDFAFNSLQASASYDATS